MVVVEEEGGTRKQGERESYIKQNSFGGRFLEAAPLVAFMYLALSRMPGERFCRQFGSLLIVGVTFYDSSN